MSDMRRLMGEAARLGVRVQLAHIEDETLFGFYDHQLRLITVDIGLSLPQKMEAIAHELGHCFYGDPCSTPAYERRADRYASMFLIDLAGYISAEMIDPDPASIAAELGQTRRMVRVFQKEHLPTLSLSRHLRSGRLRAG
jgi:Zn-dependent peptidase ImmA (M78 family)